MKLPNKNIRGRKIKTCVILFFILYMVSIFACVGPTLLPYQEVISASFRYLAFIFVILHAVETLGKKKATIFFLITLSAGFIAEYLGVVYGFVFGKYVYHGYANMILGAVPLETPLSWSVIIYTCYAMTNLLLRGFGSEKPNRAYSWWYLFCLLTLLSSIDGLAAVNIDMILDPVCVNNANPSWTWESPGPYFGIPITNFVGWFMVTFIATTTFRTYELITDEESPNNKIRLLDFMPVVIYGTYTLRYVSASLGWGQVEYTLIGITTMAPFLLMAMIVFLKHVYRFRKCKLASLQ